MPTTSERIHWPELVRPYGETERALGHLAFALKTTRLHQTWLWRETTRVSVVIAQVGGHHATVDELRRVLIAAPVDPGVNSPGLAVAKRIFLHATPLFRAHQHTNSKSQLWPEFWRNEALHHDGDTPSVDVSEGGEAPRPDNKPLSDGAGEGGQRKRLIGLVRELAGLADDGRRPALVNLFIHLRRHATARSLPPHLLRLTLPLTLVEADVVPQAAPGLLGGRRLPLGMSTASPEAKPLSDWLKAGLEDLARDAQQSHRRLAELTAQHRTWYTVLAAAGLRRHARAPEALDLLAATPVLSIGLVARHLGCSHVAAGKITQKLVELGILICATSRSRHKIFIAGDLPAATRGEAAVDQPLAFSEPVALVDVDALSATLDSLFADLERLNDRAVERVKAGG